MASLIRWILPFLVGLGMANWCEAGWLNPTQPGFVIQTFTSYEPISGNNSGTIVTNGNSYQFAGDNTGAMFMGGPGSQFRGKNDGSVYVDGDGSFVLGSFASLATVNNQGKGSLLLGNLSVGQKAVITDVGNASILLGAGTVSNSQSIVVGDGNESHGNKSVTAGSFWGTGSGFFGNGAGLTNLADDLIRVSYVEVHGMATSRGWYKQIGTHGGSPLYQRLDGAYFLYVAQDYGVWVISAVPENLDGLMWWNDSGKEGYYSPFGYEPGPNPGTGYIGDFLISEVDPVFNAWLPSFAHLAGPSTGGMWFDFSAQGGADALWLLPQTLNGHTMWHEATLGIGWDLSFSGTGYCYDTGAIWPGYIVHFTNGTHDHDLWVNTLTFDDFRHVAGGYSNCPPWWVRVMVQTNMPSPVDDIRDFGRFAVVNGTQLVFVAGAVTNVLDADITHP